MRLEWRRMEQLVEEEEGCSGIGGERALKLGWKVMEQLVEGVESWGGDGGGRGGNV